MHPRGIPNARAFRSIRLMATLIAILATVLGTAVPSFASPGPVAASSTSSVAQAISGGPVKASLDGFSAGNIISDAVFTDKSTMTEAQIQAFFDSKVKTCRGGIDEDGRPIICLKDYRTTSVNRPADKYCGGYTGAPNESAARIIYRVAQSCNINPQVLIVMLQKEQSLVTHTWPSAWRYDKALGQGCPDDAPCNPAYVGFFYQIYGAARQMQIYMEGVYFKWYAPGNTWNILFNPNRACGTSPVYVANKATSALYYYTPYQPNAAALNAGYGFGDGCSSYGNRNFYNYFTDWFGSATTSNARIMRNSSSGATYLIAGATKYVFPSAERAAQFTWIAPIEAATSAQLDGYVDGGVAPRAVRTSLGYVYLLDGGRRLQVPSCAAALDYGWKCSELPTVSQIQVYGYRDAGLLAPSIQGAGSTWLVQGGIRREIADTTLLWQYGISSAVSAVADSFVNEYALGDPVLGAGTYADATGKIVTVLQSGIAYDVAPVAQVDSIRSAAMGITAGSLARVHTVGELPVAILVDGRSYVLGNNGWTAVDAYGAAVAFTALPSGALSAMPQTVPVYGPHFVRERSSLQVFLVSGGALQPVTGEQQRQITGWYGVPPTVHLVADTVLGRSVGAGKGIVRSADGSAYLIDGVNRYRFLNCGQVADWGGDCAQLVTVSASQLSQTTDRGWLNYIVRHSDGTIWLIQSGTRRELVDPSILAPYGISPAPTPLSSTLLEPLAIGTPVLGAGPYSDGASGLVLVNTAGNFDIPQGSRLPFIVTRARKLTPRSFALLSPQAALPVRMLSSGRSLVLTEQGWLPVDPAQYGGTQQFTAVNADAWLGLPVLPTEPRPHFVRVRTSDTTFLVSGGVLQPIADDAARNWIVSYFGVPSTVWLLPADAIKGLSLSVGIAFRDLASGVSLSDGTTFYRFASCDAAATFGRNCETAPLVSSAELGMANGGFLAPLLRTSDGVLWLVQGGVRREVPDPALLAPYGIGSASTLVSTALLSGFPVGDPVVGTGTYRDPAGSMLLVTGIGRVLNVPGPARVETLTTRVKSLTAASFQMLHATGTLEVRAKTDSGHYVLSSQGWLLVDPRNYGSLTFTTTFPDIISAVPSAGTGTGPRFVREASASQVYLASGGLTAVSAEDQTFITKTYGVPSTVVIVADGALH